MKKLEHIVPTKEDNFHVKEISPGVFKIVFENTVLKVKMFPNRNAGENFELIDFPEFYDKKMKKLVSYVYHVLIPKFE